MEFNAALKVTANVVGQAELDKLNASLEKTGKTAGVSAKQTREAFRQLPNQFTDVVTQLAGGQNPFLILIQQGGQIKDSFGGIVPAGRALLSVLTPMRLALGGVAVAGVTMAGAFIAGQMESTALSRALALTNNQAGLTTGQFEKLAKSIDGVGGVTAGMARDLAQAAVASGQFGPRSIGPVTEAMAQLARVSGRTAEEVADDFKNMRGNALQWAEEKNKAYNFLTPEVYKLIRALQEQGDTEGAIVAAVGAFSSSMQEREVRLGYLEKAWKGVKEMASGAWDAMKGIGREESVDEKIATLTAKLKEAQTQVARMDGNGGTGLIGRLLSGRANDRITGWQEQLAALQKQKEAEEAKTKAQAESNAENERGILLEKTRVALIGPSAALELAGIQNRTQARMAALDAEQAKLEQVKARGLIGDQQYADRSLEITRQKIGQEIALIQAKIAAERGREITTGDPVRQAVEQKQQQVKLAQLDGELAAARNKLGAAVSASGLAEIERNQKEGEERFRKLTQFYTQTTDTIRQFAQENERARIALIKDPIAQRNAELDQELSEVERKYGTLAENIRQNIERAIIVFDDEGVARLRAQLKQVQDELEKARANIASSRPRDGQDWIRGFTDGFEQWARKGKDFASQVEDATVSALDGMSDALANFVATGKLNFREFAASVLADLSKLIIKQLFFNAIKNGISLGGATFAANGMAFGSSGVRAFAKGGVVNGATPFKFAQGGAMRDGVMGEAGPEAIMPLKRTSSGRLGVEVAGGGGGGGTNVQVNVNMTTGEESAQSDSTNGAQLGRNIASAVKQVIIQEQRPGGLLYA